MSTLFVTSPPEVQEWLARRHRLGLDKKDEVWEGVYHVAPAEHVRNGMVAMRLVLTVQQQAAAAGLTPSGPFNLGEEHDYRIPDVGFHRDVTLRQYMPTAAVVIEVLSPGDETWAKFDFYAAHGVDEVWVVDPTARSVRIWELGEGMLTETGSSGLLRLTAHSVEHQMDWP